jgi:hypothetical protein
MLFIFISLIMIYKYILISEGCGVEIVDTYGVIVSPHPVPNDLMCTWTLDAGEKASRGMVLKFLTLNLAQDSRTSPTTRSEDKFMVRCFTSC